MDNADKTKSIFLLQGDFLFPYLKDIIFRFLYLMIKNVPGLKNFIFDQEIMESVAE